MWGYSSSKFEGYKPSKSPLVIPQDSSMVSSFVSDIVWPIRYASTVGEIVAATELSSVHELRIKRGQISPESHLC
ncbi:hypothetical protein Sjap_025461 [Stephania japonica]|uniref:Uncharacterized protein n=1 Tax=Stephania japonica TaxID=461633 RepID=A0AAP0HJL1_9MAGN